MAVVDSKFREWIAEFKKANPSVADARAILDTAQYAFAAGRAAQREHDAALRAAPEGFVMVPVEPTDEMKRAGTAHVSNPYGLARDVWAAMLAARPQGVKDGR